MKENDQYRRLEWQTTMGEVRQGAIKYVEAMVEVMKKLKDASPIEFAKELTKMGYAMGVIAGKYSDSGLEGFTILLNGIMISMDSEDRKERMQYAVWDKNGVLHTSDEGFRVKKGGES